MQEKKMRPEKITGRVFSGLLCGKICRSLDHHEPVSLQRLRKVSGESMLDRQ